MYDLVSNQTSKQRLISTYKCSSEFTACHAWHSRLHYHFLKGTPQPHPPFVATHWQNCAEAVNLHLIFYNPSCSQLSFRSANITMSPPSQGKPLPLHKSFAASAIAACVAEVLGSFLWLISSPLDTTAYCTRSWMYLNMFGRLHRLPLAD